MTTDERIEAAARQALEHADNAINCWTNSGDDPTTPDEAAAKAVAAVMRRLVDEAVREEREACAQVVEGGAFLHDASPEALWARKVAAAIRQREGAK